MARWWNRDARLDSGNASAASDRLAGRRPELMEPLEERKLLYVGPFLGNFPAIASLASPLNTVVRMQTNLGIVDIEMFDVSGPNGGAPAPITVQNFLNYIRDGDYEDVFSHRAADLSGGVDFVVQMGGFKFTDEDGESDVPTDPPIVNEFSATRSNIERTISMAKLGGNPNSATSQFFFNMRDNSGPPAFLDSQNGGFTVFGRVIQGWSIVQAIGALNTEDLDLELTGSEGSLYDEVPVTNAYNPNVGPTEDTLVRIVDIEVVKPRNVARFYERAVYYPEGFRGANIVERLDLVNANPSAANHYQVIVRYEDGIRDGVIATGVIGRNARTRLVVSDAANAGLNLVRSGVGYAIEVRSTLPLQATLNHRDFGVTLEESYLVTSGLTEGTLKNWNFGDGEKGPGHRAFLVWQNLSNADITVNIAVYSGANPVPKVISLPLESYRRGGINIHHTGIIPNGRFSVRITSTGPIIAALSSYEFNFGANPVTTNGATGGGTALSGKAEGYLAAAMVPTTGSSIISLTYTAGSPAAVIVNFDFILTNGTILSGNAALLTTSVRRLDYDLAAANVNLPRDQWFSIRYRAANGVTPVSAQWTLEQNGDTMTTPFATYSTQRLYFAGGFMDPTRAGTTHFETVSILNPYASVGHNVAFTYNVKFHFSDGTVLQGPLGPLNPLARKDFRADQIPAVLAKINSNAAFRFYSISIVTTQTDGGGAFTGAAVAQLTRIQSDPAWRQTSTTQAGLYTAQVPIFLDHPSFD